MYKLVTKLKAVKVELKKLNVRRFQHLERRVGAKLEVLIDLQS